MREWFDKCAVDSTSLATTIDTSFCYVSTPLEKTVFHAIDIAPYIDASEPVEILLILIWLMAASLFLTVYLGFINIRYFKHGIDLIRGKVNIDEGSEGQINRFQALMTTMSGTVGLGNIGGVAIAVSIGGAGAIFWMFVMGLFGMTTKFVEASLGIKYREHNDKNHPGRLSGGPMYYIKHAFAGTRLEKMGVFLAALFAVFCVLATMGAGPIYQTNQAFSQYSEMTTNTDDNPLLFGLVISVLVGAVIIGGIKSIAAVASKIVPIMGCVYVISGLIVILYYADQIPAALTSIVSNATSLEAGIGGLFGAIIQGVRRAAFSNEAGIGSAAIGHSAVKTSEPVSQGFVAMLGPFIDTCVICMITGLVIVLSGAANQSTGMEGVELTSAAMGTVSPIFPYILLFTVQLFAFSTIIAWSYYGQKSWNYLLGTSPAKDNIYKIIICACVFIGAAAELKNVISFTDAMVFAMAVPNIIALYILAPSVKRDVKKYVEKYIN